MTPVWSTTYSCVHSCLGWRVMFPGTPKKMPTGLPFFLSLQSTLQVIGLSVSFAATQRTMSFPYVSLAKEDPFAITWSVAWSSNLMSQSTTDRFIGISFGVRGTDRRNTQFRGRLDIHSPTAVIRNAEHTFRGGWQLTAYLVTSAGAGPHAGLVFGHWGQGNKAELLAEAKLC